MTVALIFGRLAPPTKGHLKLIEVLAAQPADDHLVFLSHSFDKKNNPLPYDRKCYYVQKMLEENQPSVRLVESDARTIIEALQQLTSKYDTVTFVAGGDRIKEFSKLLTAYNAVPDKAGNILYSFESIAVVSAGERDDDSEGVEGFSASKMRQAAREGDKSLFATMAPFSDQSTIDSMYEELRSLMEVVE